MRTIEEIMEKANEVKSCLLDLTSEKKNQILNDMAQCLREDTALILKTNQEDLDRAKEKISEVMMDRLALSESRIDGMAKGIEDVALLPDPIGEITEDFVRPNGMRVRRMRVPMGVIAIVFESRPNVTSDAAVLAFKAGSAVILRSGRDAHETAAKVVFSLQRALEKHGLPKECIQLVEDLSHESVNTLMTARGKVDLLIPRGGKNLIQSCVLNATIPVLETGTGICHVYVDRDADQEMALRIIENAKCSRPSVCNAMEVCLVHKDIADEFIPKLRKLLVDDRKAKNLPEVQIHEDEFDTEFLNYEMGLGIVSDVTEAIAHINLHSTGHSECIVTKNQEAAEAFLLKIDSSSVYHNVSTRFTDGGEFGLGCEIGISTQKLHARGPMGLRELCTYKYLIVGDGQVR